MPQNKLSNTTALQWELSNTQYYLDDSAPPVPNVTLGKVEENSLVFHSSSDVVSLGGEDSTPSGVLDLQNFMGVPNALDFDYSTGVTGITLDHVFYSQLNVETKLPPYYVSNSSSSFEGYIRDFIPAMCGIYNVEIPVGGTHLAYYGNPSYSSQDRFGVTDFGEAMQPSDSNWASVNRSNTPTRYVDTLDFVFHITNVTYGSITNRTADITTYFGDFNIRILLTGNKPNGVSGRDDLSVSVFYQDSDVGELEAIVNYTAENINIGAPQMVRVDVANNKVELLFNRIDNSSESYSGNYSPPNNFPRSRVVKIFGGLAASTNYTMQIIGYQNYEKLPLPEQYEDSIFYKKYYYPLFDFENIRRSIRHTLLPKYSGNAWEYVNKISSLFPLQRIV